jgi:hypothetical protein
MAQPAERLLGDPELQFHSPAKVAGGHAGARRIAILTPVLDDWESFTCLISDIARHVDSAVAAIDVVAVDDGSVQHLTAGDLASLDVGDSICSITVIRLALNLGHQRAIAVGLSWIAKREDLDAVIVMDGDGEDRPADIIRLISTNLAQPDHVIMAHRSKRSEGMAFKAGYLVYKLLFRSLTGKNIAFGNFSLLPIAAVRRLVHVPDLWNNLPAAIMRSRLRFLEVGTIRGRRYAGQSRMNYASLVVHGFSAMSVYADVVFVRILMATSAVVGLVLAAMIAVLGVRFGTSLAIPGWATTVFGNLVIILAQAMVMIVATTLVVLANRSSRPLVPICDSPVFIAELISFAADRPKAVATAQAR